MTQFDEGAFIEAWNDEYATEGGKKRRRRFRRSGGSPRMRAVAIATGIVAIGITPVGIAATGDPLREGVRNGTTTQETQIVSRVDSTTARTGGFATRQSNLSATGGGAIYGCRSGAGGTAANPPQNPCVRANNLNTGYAFEFNATNGPIAGLITAGSGGDAKKPFVTNATGVATGLNADRVDGQNAEQLIGASVALARQKQGLDADTVDGTDSAALKTRWALVNEQGAIEEQSGGFQIVDCYTTNDNCYIDSGASMLGKGITASIVLQNRVDVDGAAGADPSFSGEISVSRCQIPDIVECAPAGAKNTNAFVVSPRNSDGTATADGARKRFYVTVTE